MLSLLISLIFSGTSAQAETLPPAEFCKSYLTLRDEKAGESLRPLQALPLLLAPGRVVHSEQVGRPLPLPARSGDGKKLILVLLPGSELSERDEARLRALSKMRKRLSRIDLLEVLDQVKEVSDCESALHHDPFGAERIGSYLQAVSELRPLIEAKRNLRLKKALLARTASFERAGYQVKSLSSYFDVLSTLRSDPSIREILIAAHADPEGHLYDTEGRMIPRGFLLNLPTSLRKVILFSCHTAEVLKVYEADRAAAGLDIHYPVLSPNFKKIYESSVPVIALPGLLRSARSGIGTEAAPVRECRIRVSLPADAGRLVLALNDRLIGILDHSRELDERFDCSLLDSTKNVFKLHHLEGEERIPPRVSSMHLSTPDRGEIPLRVREFVSTDGESHIQTIGT
jgi:nucleotide-binding universal stress UspA family protein